MNQKLRAAVLGVGYLGRFHAQKWKSLSDIELCGVYDAQQSVSERVANELEVKSFSSPSMALQEIDVVSVAASTSAHFELVRQALEAGVHVFVEKPITSTVSQARELIDLAKSKNLLLGVGHIERFNPAYTVLKSELKDPQFLKFERLTPFKTRGTDVSVVHDLMIHDLDLMCDLFNAEPLKVVAGGHKFVTSSLDEATAFFEFSKNRKAVITVSRVSQVAARTLRAASATFLWNVDLGLSRIDKVKSLGSELHVESLMIEKKDPLLLEILAFIEAVRQKQTPLVDGSQGLRALQWVEQVIRALSL